MNVYPDSARLLKKSKMLRRESDRMMSKATALIACSVDMIVEAKTAVENSRVLRKDTEHLRSWAQSLMKSRDKSLLH